MSNDRLSWIVRHSIMLKVTRWRFNQSAKQLVVGRTTMCCDVVGVSDNAGRDVFVERTRLYDGLVEYFPDSMTQPRANLTDMVSIHWHCVPLSELLTVGWPPSHRLDSRTGIHQFELESRLEFELNSKLNSELNSWFWIGIGIPTRIQPIRFWNSTGFTNWSHRLHLQTGYGAIYWHAAGWTCIA